MLAIWVALISFPVANWRSSPQQFIFLSPAPGDLSTNIFYFLSPIWRTGYPQNPFLIASWRVNFIFFRQPGEISPLFRALVAGLAPAENCHLFPAGGSRQSREALTSIQKALLCVQTTVYLIYGSLLSDLLPNSRNSSQGQSSPSKSLSVSYSADTMPPRWSNANLKSKETGNVEKLNLKLLLRQDPSEKNLRERILYIYEGDIATFTGDAIVNAGMLL